MISTLDPANGLTRGWQMRPPGDGHPMWRVAADIGGLAVRGQDIADYPMHAVGAYGAGRADTITRAAGEAVERFALFPRDGLKAIVATARELGSAGLDFAGASLGDPDAVDVPLHWYSGSVLGASERIWVPAGLVDYPADTPWFDPTPSGAASGPSLEFATHAGLLEVIERDAIAVAWAARSGFREIHVDAEIAAATPTADWRHLGRLLDSARRQGLVPRLIDVRVLPGLHCVLAAVVDGPALAAVGAKAHPDLGRALLIALQEALQVRETLGALRAKWGTVSAPDVVRDDVDRARLWLTADAVHELERRLSDLPVAPTSKLSVPVGTLATGGRRPALDCLVATVTADGGSPVIVDLTARLPDVHREMGWRAVKVVVPGYQPLRMDERHTFGWRHDRIEAASDGPADYFPHPLI